MNNAQINGLRMLSHSTLDAGGKDYPLSIVKTDAGWEARKGGKLVGIATTRAGALELLTFG